MSHKLPILTLRFVHLDPAQDTQAAISGIGHPSSEVMEAAASSPRTTVWPARTGSRNDSSRAPWQSIPRRGTRGRRPPDAMPPNEHPQGPGCSEFPNGRRRSRSSAQRSQRFGSRGESAAVGPSFVRQGKSIRAPLARFSCFALTQTLQRAWRQARIQAWFPR